MSKNIEVILTDSVYKLGSMGELVKVKVGYARNYLFPYRRAIPVDGASKKKIEALRAKAQEIEAKSEKQAADLKKKLEGLKITVKARVSHEKHLFGSVGAKEIVAALKELGFTLQAAQIHLHHAFKELGSYEVIVHLWRKIETKIQLDIVDADPNSQRLKETIEEAGKKPSADKGADKAADKAGAKPADKAAEAPKGAGAERKHAARKNQPKKAEGEA